MRQCRLLEFAHSALAPCAHRHLADALGGSLGLNLRWRYIGPTQNDGLSYNPNLSGDGYYTVADHISSYSYFDLSAAYR